MPRADLAPALPLPPLDRDGLPLPRQIADHLRQAILTGSLRPGIRLPASRALAAHWSISRNTVLAAYEQLLAEGFLQSRPGSGTLVAPLPTPAPRTDHPPSRPLSRRAELYLGLQRPLTRAWTDALVPGIPDLDHFPWSEWSRLLARRWRRPSREMLVPNQSAGYAPLCAAIADWLGRTRGVRCAADQVLIVSGSQQALDLAARVLLDPGQTVMIEHPCYGGLRGVLDAAQAHVAAQDVDDQGFDILRAEQDWPQARMVWVTPSHQYPTGATMPLARRLALVDWVKRRQGWIVEDDYDSDFCHAGPPLPALQGLDNDSRTLHIGTFSKSMFPGLRLGWMVLPPDLVGPFLAARRLADVSPPSLTQAAMADFMAEGGFARHLKRMRVLYGERRAVFLRACTAHLGEFGRVNAGETGLHSVLWLHGGQDDDTLAAKTRKAGIGVPCLSEYGPPVPHPGLVLGWGHIAAERLEQCVARLAQVLRS